MLPSFTYASDVIPPTDVIDLPHECCDCAEFGLDCAANPHCKCRKRNVQERSPWASSQEGLLRKDIINTAGLLIPSKKIFECGPGCACSVGRCGLKTTQRGINVPIGVKWYKRKGWGVFARRFIPENTFVFLYGGEILSGKQKGTKSFQAASEREAERNDGHDATTFCIFAADVTEDKRKPFACDGRYVANAARLVNHSCDANLSMVKVYRAGLSWSTLGFIARRDIEVDEELTWKYTDKKQMQDDGVACWCEKCTASGKHARL
mmetsp:Transcript_14671/g.44071  ORF Transcript_14671/g.44071 Transcript_14671/m.44071 type:complete len:264 (-) Transcript_14671:80-871(-)